MSKALTNLLANLTRIACNRCAPLIVKDQEND